MKELSTSERKQIIEAIEAMGRNIRWKGSSAERHL